MRSLFAKILVWFVASVFTVFTAIVITTALNVNDPNARQAPISLFLTFLVRPLRSPLGEASGSLGQDIVRMAGWAAIGLVVAEGAGLAMRVAVLVSTLEISIFDALGAQFALAGIARICAALLLAAVLFGAGALAPAWLLLSLVAAVLCSATLATHAAARVQGSLFLLIVAALHRRIRPP